MVLSVERGVNLWDIFCICSVVTSLCLFVCREQCGLFWQFGGVIKLPHNLQFNSTHMHRTGLSAPLYQRAARQRSLGESSSKRILHLVQSYLSNNSPPLVCRQIREVIAHERRFFVSPAALLIERGRCLKFFPHAKCSLGAYFVARFEEDFLHFKSMLRAGALIFRSLGVK